MGVPVIDINGDIIIVLIRKINQALALVVIPHGN